MIILGIETSCDETAISVVQAEGGLEDLRFKVLGSAVHSQIDIHREYGGVFPTLAKREHIKNLPIVLEEALKKAGFDELRISLSADEVENYELWKKENKNKKFPIDLITVTVGPGLEPALWTGIKFGEKLGKSWGIPVMPTNHMVGHIVSVLGTENYESRIPPDRVILAGKNQESDHRKIEWPAIALLISGGHTELVAMNSWIDKKKIGETQDDAVGEAFDKVARMLGLPYPGGPEISRLASQVQKDNEHLEIRFPRPMMHSKDYNFSFSGLKTAVLYYLKANPDADKVLVAKEFQDAIVETLLFKTKKAIIEYAPKTLIVGGGVIANKELREKFCDLERDFDSLRVLIPEKELTTDNATMISMAGYIDYMSGDTKIPAKLQARGHLEI
ncbi:MAG: tRNA (adenosine(37)-N6)-threonylcarbamoyltransferase complex transferase subunit TsaD [Patescibacteria group bacterium]